MNVRGFNLASLSSTDFESAHVGRSRSLLSLGRHEGLDLVLGRRARQEELVPCRPDGVALVVLGSVEAPVGKQLLVGDVLELCVKCGR